MTQIETEIPERLPVFVYGTLRASEGPSNYAWCLANKTASERPAVLRGGQMRDNHGFPYVIITDDPKDVIVGELMEIQDHLYERVTANLDGLEGFYGEGHPRNHYDKRVVTVVTEDGQEHQAHTYVVPERNIATIVKRCAHIESGDWIAFDQARPADTALFAR